MAVSWELPDRQDDFWYSAGDYNIGGESTQLRRWGEPFLRESLRAARESGRPLLFVDFGCWSGRHFPLLMGLAHECGAVDPSSCVVGIDRAEATHRVAEARALFPGIRLLTTGLAHTTLPDDSVDAALSWRVLHNLPPADFERARSEMRRVLRDGAPVVVAVRAVRPGMPQDEPTPVARRSSPVPGRSRVDFYFSERACASLFGSHGFEMAHRPVRFLESETYDGVLVQNIYWMLRLIHHR